jgi:hypothetical protein
MAVLDALPGLNVSIHVDGEPLPEYEDETEEETPDGDITEYQASGTVCKYVEAMSDKEFCIKITLNSPYKMDCPTLMFRISIDGIHASAPIIKKAAFPHKLLGDLVISPMRRTVEGVRVEAPGSKDREFIKKL